MTTPELVASLQERLPPFARWLGLRIVSVERDHLVAELVVREDLCRRGGIIHGGAMMSFADTLGAVATILNLPPERRTATLESKTNFIGSARLGETIRGEATPIHRGRTTQVWQTRLTGPDGRLLAVVTQTQLVMDAPAGT